MLIFASFLAVFAPWGVVFVFRGCVFVSVFDSLTTVFVFFLQIVKLFFCCYGSSTSLPIPEQIQRRQISNRFKVRA